MVLSCTGYSVEAVDASNGLLIDSSTNQEEQDCLALIRKNSAVTRPSVNQLITHGVSVFSEKLNDFYRFSDLALALPDQSAEEKCRKMNMIQELLLGYKEIRNHKIGLREDGVHKKLNDKITSSQFPQKFHCMVNCLSKLRKPHSAECWRECKLDVYEPALLSEHAYFKGIHWGSCHKMSDKEQETILKLAAHNALEVERVRSDKLKATRTIREAIKHQLRARKNTTYLHKLSKASGDFHRRNNTRGKKCFSGRVESQLNKCTYLVKLENDNSGSTFSAESNRYEITAHHVVAVHDLDSSVASTDTYRAKVHALRRKFDYSPLIRPGYYDRGNDVVVQNGVTKNPRCQISITRAQEPPKFGQSLMLSGFPGGSTRPRNLRCFFKGFWGSQYLLYCPGKSDSWAGSSGGPVADESGQVRAVISAQYNFGHHVMATPISMGRENRLQIGLRGLLHKQDCYSLSRRGMIHSKCTVMPSGSEAVNSFPKEP